MYKWYLLKKIFFCGRMNNKTKIFLAWYLFRSGLDEPTRMGETCGAVTGAFMVLGVKYGKTRIEDERAKEKTRYYSLSKVCPRCSRDY
ncbi:putative redox-active protein [Candidatus Methanophagaceae archaeon]|jgi:hypothetical protein|nr:putative redox-active protein [Methanophagales archaeon]